MVILVRPLSRSTSRRPFDPDPIAHCAIQLDQGFLASGRIRACRDLTPNIHSSHDLYRPEAKRVRVKLTNLNIPKVDLVEFFIDLLEAENLKSKNFADEHPPFMPANVAAVVHSSKHKSMRIYELDRISRQEHRTWLIDAAWSGIV
jgi:hypothetical protein